MAINNETPQNRVTSSQTRSNSNFRSFASPQEQSRFSDSLKRQESQTQSKEQKDSKKPESQNRQAGQISQKEARPFERKSDANDKDLTDKAEAKSHHEKDAELFAWNGAAQGHSGNNMQSDMSSISSSAAGLDAQLKAQLDRIAAAIAEHSANGKQGQFTLQLPAGLPIESAVLARGVNGLISVLLVARPGTLGLQERRLMRSELTERLKQRKIPMSEIGFSDRNS